MTEGPSLQRLYSQVVQEKLLSSMLSNEISGQRELMENSIKQIISTLRNFCLLDTFYPRLTENTVLQLLQSPLYLSETRKIYDTPSALPYTTATTMKVNSFLKNFYPYTPLIAKCVDEYFNQVRDNFPYNPCHTPLSFAASSTLPALFGYCWCAEQGSAYIELLCQLIVLQLARSKSVASSSFRNSYTREILRQFLHFIGVQKYLQHALSSSLFNFLYDKTLDSYVKNSQEYYDALTVYVDHFTNGLINSLPLAPPLLRHFLHRAHESVKPLFPEGSTEPRQLVSFLFVEILLLPAFLNPKQFSLIPDTSIDPCSPHVTALIHVLRWAADPLMMTTRGTDVGITDMQGFKSLKTGFLVDQFCTYDDSFNGVYFSQIQKVADMNSHPILIGVNDLLFLSKIVNETLGQVEHDTTQKERLRFLCSYTANLEGTELIDFWFNSYKIPTTPLPEPSPIPDMFLPLFVSPSVSPPDDALGRAVRHLIVYLESSPPIMDTTNDIYEYLEARKASATATGSLEWVTRTEAVLTKLYSVNCPSETVLTRLDITLRDLLSKHSLSFEVSFKHKILNDGISNLLKSVREMSLQLTPIIHQGFINLFISRHKSIQETIQRDMLILINKTENFLEFFVTFSNKLVNYAKECGFGETHTRPLLRQLHSACIQMLPMEVFITLNMGQKKRDEKLVALYDGLLENFIKDDYSSVLTRLFGAPTCFETAVEILKSGTSVGAPLERLAKIDACMATLNDIYSFEAGEGCPGDDFLPMFVYVLLLSKLPNLAILHKWMKHFLLSLEGHVVLIDSKEKYVATTFVSAADLVFSQAGV